MTEHVFSINAYAPAEMAQRVETVGMAKAKLDATTMFALAVLAGAFIALGGHVATVVFTENGLGYGVSRRLGGMVFSLGLILVIVGGAELFTGNNLIIMAWASGKLPTSRLLLNWGIVYIGNFVGGLSTAVGVYLSRQ
jgi:formate transporter